MFKKSKNIRGWARGNLDFQFKLLGVERGKYHLSTWFQNVPFCELWPLTIDNLELFQMIYDFMTYYKCILIIKIILCA